MRALARDAQEEIMGIDAEMFIRTKHPITPEILRRAEHMLFAIFGEDLHSWNDRILEVVAEWEQDGPTLRPDEGETFVRVHLATRYYGEGYERGNFRLIHDIAEALETLIPGGEVWYGGDSSGACAEKFGAAERAELRAYWLKHAHKPYHGVFWDGPGPKCRRCDVPMPQYGSGPRYSSHSCECGEKRVMRDGVVTVTTREERNERKHALERKAREALAKVDPAAAAELNNLWMWY
jgi:hypothetical protein